MASKSWACLLFSLPPLAKRLRQTGVSTVIAASLLFLLLPAEASAQAPLVTIQTRVVTKNSPNPYSTLVGTATDGATGAGPGYHVVVLNRATHKLVWNRTYTLSLVSLNSMNSDIGSLSSSALVIISCWSAHFFFSGRKPLLSTMWPQILASERDIFFICQGSRRPSPQALQAPVR